MCVCNAPWWPRAGPMLALCKRPALHVRQRHFHNGYSGNEATRFTITRTLGTSLLTVGAADMVIFIAP